MVTSFNSGFDKETTSCYMFKGSCSLYKFSLLDPKGIEDITLEIKFLE